MKLGAEVFHIGNPNTKKLESFLLQEKSSLVFQTFQIYKVFREIINYNPIFIVIEDNESKIQGILLAVIQKEHSGILGIFSSRSIIIGGPIVLNNNIEVLDQLLKKYNEKVKHKAIYSQFRNLREFSSEEKVVFEKHGYKYEPHLDIVHNLIKPIEEQWMALHKGRRKNIRRAERMGLIFRKMQNESEFEKAYQLVKGTYKRVKLPLPDKSLFFESYRVLIENGIFKVFVAVYDNEIIATRMVLCYNNSIYDWYAGADNQHLDKYPNDFLLWKIIEWGSKNKFKYFDFGGAGKPGIPYGVRDYKLKFGGKLVEYGRFEKIHNKFLFQIGKIGLELYKRIK